MRRKESNGINSFNARPNEKGGHRMLCRIFGKNVETYGVHTYTPADVMFSFVFFLLSVFVFIFIF